MSSYTLLSEICDEKGRRLNYIIGWVFWVIGMAIIPFIGMQPLFITLPKFNSTQKIQRRLSLNHLVINIWLLLAKWLVDWYSFGLFTTLINVVLIFMHPFLPESPRWLITENKYAEAASLINKIRTI